MTRRQRFKYEMFVRVRDFGVARAALFPEASKSGQAFARESPFVMPASIQMQPTRRVMLGSARRPRFSRCALRMSARAAAATG